MHIAIHIMKAYDVSYQNLDTTTKTKTKTKAKTKTKTMTKTQGI